MTLAEILKFIQVSYPRTEYTAENAKAYTMMLRDLPLDILQVAVFQIVSESQWLPTIAEIRGKTADMLLEREGHPPPLQAYEIALRHEIRGLRDAYPLVHRAACTACYSVDDMRRSENTAADRARFLEAYQELTRQKRAEITSTPAVRAWLGAPAESQAPQIEGGSYASIN